MPGGDTENMDDDSDDEEPLTAWHAKYQAEKAEKAKKAKAMKKGVKDAKKAQGAETTKAAKQKQREAATKSKKSTSRSTARNRKQVVEPEPEEMAPKSLKDYTEYFSIENKSYSVVNEYDAGLLKEGATIIQWFGKSYNDFYTGEIVKITNCKGGVTQKWVYFHADKYKLVIDMLASEYMKTWAFIEITEEIQAPE